MKFPRLVKSTLFPARVLRTRVPSGANHFGTKWSVRSIVSLSDPGVSYVYNTPPSNAALSPITLGQLLERATESTPDRIGFIVAHQQISKTYREFNADVDQLARALHAIDCRRGDTVGIWAVNSYQWLLTQFATAKLGAILVTVNPGYKEKELLACVNLVGLKTLITNQHFKTSNYCRVLQNISPELMKNAESHRVHSKELPTLKNLIVLDEDEEIAPSNVIRFSELMQKGQGSTPLSQLIAPEDQTYFDDVINVQFTSGTTGLPKGAMLTHHNMIQNVQFISARIFDGFTEEGQEPAVVCTPNPMYHCFGCVVGSASSVYVNGTFVLPAPIFNPQSTLAAIEQYRCNLLYGTPTMWSDILQVGVDKYNTTSLKRGVMSGASCPPVLIKKLLKAIPSMQHILIPYGTTETSPVATLTSIHDDPLHQLESTGLPLPGVEIKIIDTQTGKVVPRGQRGEVCIRGHGTFPGYFNQPEKTREIVDSNYWYHTGDIGQLDTKGYLSISGRIKEMIIRGGENIYPREIEDFLLMKSEIEDVHVVGIPDERLGEDLAAYVKVKKDATLNVDDLQTFLKDKISHFKVPKHIIFVDDFPRTITGKVRKVELKEIARKQFEKK